MLAKCFVPDQPIIESGKTSSSVWDVRRNQVEPLIFDTKISSFSFAHLLIISAEESVFGTILGRM